MKFVRPSIGPSTVTAIAIAALVLGACGHSNNVIGEGPDRTNGYVTANLGGLAFDATTFSATLSDGILTFSAEDAALRRISYIVHGVTPGMTLPRTFRLLPDSTEVVGYAQYAVPYGNVFSYYTTITPGGRADFTVRVLTDQRIEGTFYLLGARTPGSAGASGYVSITSGEFVARF